MTGDNSDTLSSAPGVVEESKIGSRTKLVNQHKGFETELVSDR
jgi:hypothetical protein